MRRAVPFLALFIAASPLAAQSPIDFSRLRPASDSFVILLQGRAVGYETTVLEKTATGFVVKDETNLMPQVLQNTEVAIGADGTMQKVTQRGQMMGKEMKIDVSYAGGQAKGTAQTPGAGGTVSTKAVDAAVPVGTVDDNVVLPLLPGIDWKPGTMVTLPVFASGQNKVQQVTLSVIATESITVPAGTFEAYKVSMAGLAAPMTLWVSAVAPHRVLKAAPQGAPMEFVAAK